MAEGGKTIRLNKVTREFNVGINTVIDFLHKQGIEIDSNPNTKIDNEVYQLLVKEFSNDISAKKESDALTLKKVREKKETISIDDIKENKPIEEFIEEDEILIKDIVSNTKTAKEKTTKIEELKEINKEEFIPQKEIKKENEESSNEKKDKGILLKVVDKIDLEALNLKTKPEKKTKEKKKDTKEKTKEKKVDKKEDILTQIEQITVETKPEEIIIAEKEEITKEQEEILTATNEELEIIEKQVAKVVQPPKTEEVFHSHIEKLSGPTIVGKIELPSEDEKKKTVEQHLRDIDDEKKKEKKKRKRIKKEIERIDFDDDFDFKKGKAKPVPPRVAKNKKIHKIEIDEEEVDRQVKDTLLKLTDRSKSKAAKYRKEKREAISQKMTEEAERQELEKKILKVAEFVTVHELSSMMDVPVNEIISACMNLGMFVSINQRLDAETLLVVADEFGYKVEFISAEVQEAIHEEPDNPERLAPRPPIVTVMGHVDHGKTKLLDYIRNTNVIAGEAGGITQHIGAYSVTLDNGRKITFLDTPGHEAFTAMRARGAQVTDVAIIVIAADDSVMPQTVEAINHALAARVPIVFAINKIDKPTANPEKIKEDLAKMDLLVEDWGGKYQSQEISAKSGININLLLEKVLVEADLLDLKADAGKKANGTVLESSLDKGRGYVATVLVKSGTLRIGDIMLAGQYYGHVKAMYNERNQRITEAGPSTPVIVLGLNGAPQAGDNFNVMTSEKEAREIANKREKLQREQSLRTRKHITLEEIGRRLAIGNFKELNIIVKGDVDGSVEALSDSLIKLSTPEIQVRIIHKAVGQISDSDVNLATASNAIIIGFQVRPSLSARKLAEKEGIDIRIYSIIYDAIEQIKAAMEGMLSPEIKEEITASLEVREVFKITKVGTVAGCLVRDGKINRTSKVHIIRDGIVIYTGNLASLKRFKDDVKEVTSGMECGLSIENFNDIKVGDIIEAFKEIEVKKKLSS